MVRQSNLAKRVQRVSTQQTMASPVGGLNALNSLAEMPPTQAVEMVNLFPQQFGCRVRKGWNKHATGLPGLVESLFTYSSALNTQKLFAIAGTNLYDVSTAGAVGAPLLVGFINNRWQHQMMVNQFGSFLSMVNGFDLPQKYNGATWTNQTMTPEAGETLDIRNLISVTLSHRRLWYVEKNSGNAWYLDIDAIEGVLTRFGVGEVFKQGGSLREIITWSVDSGSGMRDQTIFISSMGDVVVYQGYDPDDIANWNLSGVYRCGAPIGQRCAIKYGSDVLILCEDGVLPLTAILGQSKAILGEPLSNIIQLRLSGDISLFRPLFGWEMLLLDRHQMLIVNVPDPAGQRQYVMNTVTDAWTQFTGYLGVCLEKFNEEFYYGATNYVGAGWANDVDDMQANGNGLAINAKCLQAYSFFGSPALQKHWTLVRPIFNAVKRPLVFIGMNTDFDIEDNTPPLANLEAQANVALWNVAIWDDDFWSTARQTYTDWFGLNDIGFAGAAYLRMQTSAETYWVSTDFVFESGGVL